MIKSVKCFFTPSRIGEFLNVFKLHAYSVNKSLSEVCPTMDVLHMDTHRYLNEFMHLSVSKVSQ